MDNTTIELKECWHEGMDLLLYNPAPPWLISVSTEEGAYQALSLWKQPLYTQICICAQKP